MDFKYKKSLGQNFIYDTGFLQSVVSQLDIKSTDTVLEIGTGAGTLTKVLAGTGASIKTIEIDRRLEPLLQKEFLGIKNIELQLADVMKLDLSDMPSFRVVANVPYYITTPIIMKFLGLPNCTDINILVAEDVAKRIIAKPSTSEYGALSVTCQVSGKCEIIKLVGKEMFTPRPKIDSAFVRIIKYRSSLQPADDARFALLLKGIFSSRRKTMLNALSNAADIDKDSALKILADCGVDPVFRPEQLAPTKFVLLCQILTNSDK